MLKKFFRIVKNMLTGTDTNLKQWNVLTDERQVVDVLKASSQKPQLVYKHSHTCGISHAAKERIEESFDEINKQADMHFANVKKSRPVSNRVAKELGVRHESPQVLIVKNSECTWHESHWSIKGEQILSALNGRCE